MHSQEETVDQDIVEQEMAQKKAREVLEKIDKAYDKFFKSEAGKLIYTDLCLLFKKHKPPQAMLEDGSVDTNGTMISIGEHNVLDYMVSRCAGYDAQNFAQRRKEQHNVTRTHLTAGDD